MYVKYVFRILGWRESRGVHRGFAAWAPKLRQVYVHGNAPFSAANSFLGGVRRIFQATSKIRFFRIKFFARPAQIHQSRVSAGSAIPGFKSTRLRCITTMWSIGDGSVPSHLRRKAHINRFLLKNTL